MSRCDSSRARRLAALLCTVVVPGCGGADDSPAPGSTTSTGTPGCVAPEIALPDGSCFRPGIPPEGCAEGFIHDGEYGCEPILPADACPPGLMAVPGDSACRSVMDCGPGKWGDIPVDAATVYVDGSYSGGASDGTANKPWTTVGDAMAVAPDGAIIAIAEGTYAENVVVSFDPVRLWGICPERVELVGGSVGSAGCPPAALCIRDATASGTEVHGVALRGASSGLLLSGAEGVLVDRVWVHDTAGHGIGLENDLGTTSATVVGSLVEQSREAGIFVMGSEARVEGTVVRSTRPAVDQTRGVGIVGTLPCSLTPGGSLVCDTTAPSSLDVKRSVFEQNHEIGVELNGSDATIEGSVVRGTLPVPADESGGWGIAAMAFCTATPDGSAFCDPTARSNVTVKGSFIHQNLEIGVAIVGSDASIETTVVGDTLPGISGLGRAIDIELSCIRAPDGTESCDPAAPSAATVTASLVDQSRDVGIMVVGSEATVSATVVSKTLPDATHGDYGEGISALSYLAPAKLTLSASRIEDSARAGVSSFGAAISLGGVTIDCAAFELAGEPWEGIDYQFEDLGNNVCGCAAATPPRPGAPCVAASPGLVPPTPIGATP